MRTPTPKIKFPFVDRFLDYHEAEVQRNLFNRIFEEKIRVYEFGFNFYYYYVFFVGRIPSKKQIIAAMKNQGKEDEIENIRFCSNTVDNDEME